MRTLLMNASNSVRILFFGPLGEKMGREVQLDSSLRHRTVAEVKHLLALQYPQAAEDLASPRLRACIDDVMADEMSIVGSGSEVAFLPPLSGG